MRCIRNNPTEYTGALGIEDGKEVVLPCPLSQIWPRDLPHILGGGLLPIQNDINIVPP